ncbi:peptidase family m1 domain-containing protein [Ditylenchus destructor]|nr:peptidase family m1 domain-containing protein [Ditylenchus destructor]
MSEDGFSKLPRLAKPSVYDIHLSPCLKTFECHGKSTIHLDILEKTNYLKLHSSELNINNASITLENGKEFTLPVELDHKWKTMRLNLPMEVEPQKAKLSFDYVAQLNNKMQGFSRSKYTTQSGEEKYLASTQFESTYARQAFPCWDEPEYKAQFNVALEVANNLTALSNMDVIEEQKSSEGMKIVKYRTTPIMSTYLVAFAVGEFDFVETKSKGGITVRVYTVPGKSSEGQYALDLAAKCLDWYDDWFGIACPLPKCDLIAIPDFSMGAMENWGLVTYREVALLVDQAKTSTQAKARIALIVSHELAHFWFGNLVTMKWWTDLWLKEGFASFMEYVHVDASCPEFNIWLIFLKDEVAGGLALDALRSSHPIEVQINNPNELDEIYDSITYNKSNSMNRMLCNYLGMPTFQKGLRNYLKKFQYSNAETIDLWNALSEVSGQDINKLMSSWTKQMGFPVVTVEQRVEGSKRILKLKQNRFIADGGEDELNSIWQIPIEVVTAADPKKASHKILFTKSEEEVTLDGIDPNHWIKLNAYTSGFYRVRYSDEMLNALLPALRSKEVQVTDRYGLASDLFALVEAGKISATQFLNFLGASANEDEYIVWSAIDHGVGSLSNVLSHHGDAALKQKFDEYVCKCLEPVANRLTWNPKPNEESQIGLLRALILSRLAKCGHKATIDTALAKFQAYVNENADIVPDLRGMIFGCVGRTNSAEAISQLQKIFETCNFSEIERSCIMTMTQCSDKNLLSEIFDWGIGQGKVRSQDMMMLFFGAQANKVGQDFTWEYFKQNVNKLIELYGSVNSMVFQRTMRFSVDSQCSRQVASDFQDFCNKNFDQHSLKVMERPIKQTVEAISLNHQLLDNSVESIKSFLANA